MKQRTTKLLAALAILLLCCNTAAAQLSAVLTLNSRPPSYLSDWMTAQTGLLRITYGQGPPLEVILATELIDPSGTVFAASNNATAQRITLTTGVNIISIDRVLQLENLRFTGGSTSLAASGKLSPGQYILSLRVLRPDGATLIDRQDKVFTQVNFQLPYLLRPGDNAALDPNTAQTAIIFRWSSLVPLSQEAPVYRLQVFEILQQQTALQALRSNMPILLTDVTRTTQFIWHPQLPLNDSTDHPFIWTIQTLDGKGVPVTTSDETVMGRSEPRTFTVGNRKDRHDSAGKARWGDTSVDIHDTTTR